MNDMLEAYSDAIQMEKNSILDYQEHKDDHFRLSNRLRDQENNCLRDEVTQLKTEVTRLTAALDEATLSCTIYREQIKQRQRDDARHRVERMGYNTDSLDRDNPYNNWR